MKAIVMHKIAKPRLIDHQLINLLSIKDGQELSVLFHLP